MPEVLTPSAVRTRFAAEHLGRLLPKLLGVEGITPSRVTSIDSLLLPVRGINANREIQRAISWLTAQNIVEEATGCAVDAPADIILRLCQPIEVDPFAISTLKIVRLGSEWHKDINLTTGIELSVTGLAAERQIVIDEPNTYLYRRKRAEYCRLHPATQS